MDAEELARAYYAAVDADDADALSTLLAPGFVHVRPDRTIEGRDRFVSFVTEERPEPDASHEIGSVYAGDTGVAVRGRLRHADGEEWFEFVDAFDVADGAIARLRTYVR